MNIKLSDSFNYKKLLRFTAPSIIMLVFTSIYGVVDGFFVSNFTGKNAFTAVNFIMPFLMILGSTGFIFGTGGGALISKTLGEGDKKKANGLFSMIVYVSAVFGVILAVLGVLFLRPVAEFLGAHGELLESLVEYGAIILAAVPAYTLQFEFQCLFSVAEKPKLGLYVTVAVGVANMILDALFVAVLSWGIRGAAAATAISQFIGGVVPIIYFARRNTSSLKLGKMYFDFKSLLKTFSNGSSELMTNISTSVVNMLYNARLLQYAGEDGIAAYGVIMYVNMIFQAVFIGYSVGVSPIAGYCFGARTHDELKNILKKSAVIISIFAVIMFISAQILARPLSSIFVGYDAGLFEMTLRAFKIYSLVFIFAGFSIFGSSFFTALNNGLISASISFMRTLVFQVAAVAALPLVLGLNGIWFSTVAAEIASVFVTAIFFAANKKRYRY